MVTVRSSARAMARLGLAPLRPRAVVPQPRGSDASALLWAGPGRAT